MPKTRLLQSDREAIRDALVAHKFAPIERAQTAEENALADEVRAFVHGDYIKTMDRAPKGAFQAASAITVTVDGKYMPLYFGGKYPDRVERRVFYKYIDAFTSAEPLMARVLDLHGRKYRAIEDKKTLSARTLGTLSGFRTFDALFEAWPDAQKFITERWRTREGSNARQVPVALAQLSEALDLPPEEVEPVEAAAGWTDVHGPDRRKASA